MSTHTIKGWLYFKAASKFSKSGEPVIAFLPFDPKYASADTWGVPVREHSIEVEIPDDFDPRPQQVAALDAEISKVRAEFTARINELQEQKARLLAIEYVAEAS
jgi:hypothetical protein